MEKLLRRVYTSPKISASLKIISHVSSILCVFSFAVMLIYLYCREPMAALMLILAAGVPFILVSIARKIINAPRPYELYAFYEVLPKERRGRSFPSRHVFSAFLIAGLAYIVSIWLSLPLFVIGIALATSRVFLGIHFIRDVIAGALIGVLSAVLGILILF